MCTMIPHSFLPYSLLIRFSYVLHTFFKKNVSRYHGHSRGAHIDIFCCRLLDLRYSLSDFNQTFNRATFFLHVADKMRSGTLELLDVNGSTGCRHEQCRTQKLLYGGGSTNSVQDREQMERRSGGGRPLVRGSAQFANG
jgi:hypothetical protein